MSAGERGDEVVLEKVDASLASLCGIAEARRSLSLAKMDEVIAEAAAARHARR